MSIRTPDEQEEAYHEVSYQNEISFISEIKVIKPKSFQPDKREPELMLCYTLLIYTILDLDHNNRQHNKHTEDIYVQLQ